MKQKSYFQPS